MSDWRDTKTRSGVPDGLNPAGGTFTLRASAEAERVSEVFTEATLSTSVSRARLMAWLADGARGLTWALESLPRKRWAVEPPAELGEWCALRHVRHVALREARLTLPTIKNLVGELDTEATPSTADLDREDAAWDVRAVDEQAEALLAELAGVRFELLRALESAPETLGDKLELPLLLAHQHELEHLGALWRIALYWDSISTSTAPTHGSTGVPLHPADRFSESEGVRPR